ncbi:hypothetical protein SK571_18635 [Lentzea sp. BCCO 10_0798]|uniref:Uncharacterized protein n=1 Tax=Lentzea kristufekii TaxID=3095430 RepID=A0ABU4TSY0_9PSEU|nr:hypothetical protein [Lentzea sp. BCCO 10_0798]MDX8051411.1 hypothetical protein [Lentzea sp. BCCO 10_0798]
MAVMDVHNDSAEWLVVWLEPLAHDYWLRRGEGIRIRTDYTGDELAFSVSTHATDADRAAGVENLVVYVENCDFHAEVTDQDGNVLELAHQRPEGH